MAAKPVYQPQEAESSEIQELYRLFQLQREPQLVGPDGGSIPLPESVFRVLLQVLIYMKQGQGVSILPVMQELTTQQAAHILGVSRPHLVGLLKRGEIHFHQAGTHRRIYLKDLLEFRNKRDQERGEILTSLAQADVKSGVYDKAYTPPDRE